MRILISYSLAKGTEKCIPSDNIVYRPDLEDKDNHAFSKALVKSRPEVLITKQLPSAEVIAAWRTAVSQRKIFIVYITKDTTDTEEPVSEITGVPVHSVSNHPRNSTDVRAATVAERLYTRGITCAENEKILSRVRKYKRNQQQSVVLVGAGIVNVITAYYLLKAGYETTLFDGSPDPRTQALWTEFGCTNGGDDARMFTLSEADDYHDKGEVIHEAMNTLFHRDVSEQGWVIGYQERLVAHDRTWIEDHEAVPTWLAAVYNADIFAFNRESLPLWERLRNDHPELFQNVEYRPGILRLYSDLKHFQRQVARQNRIGATRDVLTPLQVKHKYPALAEAVARSEIVGGIEVIGFTVNIHKFMAKLLNHLEQAGATLHWNTRVTSVRYGDGNTVKGLTVGNNMVHADHYVLSLGAYGNELLNGFRSVNKIHGVLGLWLRVPNIEPKLEHSLKIARKGHMAEDTNVTVAKDQRERDILIFGSGYGYTGSTPDNIRSDLIEALFLAVEDTARRFFPCSYLVALESGLLRDSRRYCVRPWTASCLGLCEFVATDRNGVMVITGGHNTGGFTQSPSVAMAVLAALRGEDHPMHEYYHPDRLSAFYDRH